MKLTACVPSKCTIRVSIVRRQLRMTLSAKHQSAINLSDSWKRSCKQARFGSGKSARDDVAVNSELTRRVVDFRVKAEIDRFDLYRVLNKYRSGNIADALAMHGYSTGRARRGAEITVIATAAVAILTRVICCGRVCNVYCVCIIGHAWMAGSGLRMFTL